MDVYAVSFKKKLSLTAIMVLIVLCVVSGIAFSELIGSSSVASATPTTLNAQVNSVNNGAVGTEVTLHTYTMPASTLSADGQAVRVTVSGDFSANADVHTMKLYFGATSILSNGACNGGSYIWRGMIIRITATTQRMWAKYVCNDNSLAAALQDYELYASPGETLSGTVVIKSTCQIGAANADCTEKWFLVEKIPSP